MRFLILVLLMNTSLVFKVMWQVFDQCQVSIWVRNILHTYKQMHEILKALTLKGVALDIFKKSFIIRNSVSNLDCAAHKFIFLSDKLTAYWDMCLLSLKCLTYICRSNLKDVWTDKPIHQNPISLLLIPKLCDFESLFKI